MKSQSAAVQQLGAWAFFRVQFIVHGRSSHRRHRLSKQDVNRTTVALAAYRSGQKLHDKELGLTFDYRNRLGIYYTGILAPPDAPEWVYDRSTLWNTIQSSEIRKDAQLAREVLISLPKELSLAECKTLVIEYVNQAFVSLGMIADIAIHEPSHNSKRENIHAHVMLTMRSIDQECFGLKVRDWNARAKLKCWRESLCDLTNLYLERAGLELRVNHKGRAALELEQGKHFDYSIQYESFDIMPELLIEQDYCLEEPLPNELILESSIVKADYSGAKIEPERCDINIPPNLNNPTTLGEETLDLHDNASQFHQFQQELKSLVIPGNDIELTDDQRLIQIENLAQLLEKRLKRVELSIANHTEPACRERLQLQVEIEKSFFLEQSSKLRASILEKKERFMHIDSIIAYRREAALSGKAYKTHAYEWCRRSVRDPNYFSIDSNLDKQVERIRSSEKTRWDSFDERVLKSRWDQSKRDQEVEILQQRLDKEIMITLERSLGLNREIELSR